MTAVRALIPAPPDSHVRTTPRRARLLAEIDAAIVIRERAITMAEQRLRSREGTADAFFCRATVDDLAAGLAELRRAQERVA